MFIRFVLYSLLIGSSSLAFALSEQEVVHLAQENAASMRALALETPLLADQMRAAQSTLAGQWQLKGQLDALGNHMIGPLYERKTAWGTQLQLSAQQGKVPHWQLGVEQPLRRGRSKALNTEGIAQAQEAQDSFEVEVQQQKQHSAVTGLAYYYDAMLTQARHQQAVASHMHSKRLLEAVQAKISAGRLSLSEQVQAEHFVLQQEIALEKARNSNVRAFQKLSLYLEYDLPKTLEFELPEIQLQPLEIYEANAWERTGHARKHHIAKVAAERQISIAKQAKQIDLNWYASVNQDSATTGLRLVAPLGAQASSQYALSRATTAQKKLYHQQAQEKQQYTAQLISLYDSARSQLNQLTLTEQAMRIAYKTYEQAQAKFDAGRMGLFEVLSLKTQSQAAESAFLEAKVAYVMSIYQLEAHTGSLLSRWGGG